MAEAHEENRKIPSDQSAVRIVIRKPTTRRHMNNRIPSGMTKHPVFSCLLPRLHDDLSFLPDPFGAVAEFEATVEKAKRHMIFEFSRQTPDSIGANLLLASTAIRAYRNRHLGTLMRCCEAFMPIEDCFDTFSFECVDFQRFSQIIANFYRETLAGREAEITNLPWT